VNRDDHPFPDAPRLWRAELAETFQLAWPLVLTQLAQMAIYTTDVLMIGRLGPNPLAASALAVNLLAVLNFTGIGLVTAVAPIVAAALGARRHAVREVRRSFRAAIHAALIYSLFAWVILWNGERLMLAFGQDPALSSKAADFLRILQWTLLPNLLIVVFRSVLAALGKPGVSLVVVIVGLLCNALGNYALIFGHWGAPALGLAGSAIASVITTVAMAALLIGYILMQRKVRRFHLFGRLIRFDRNRLGAIFRIGLPIGGAWAFEVSAFSAAVYLMGLIDTPSVAAHTIALQIASLTFMVPLGLSQAVTIRVGMGFGARDPHWISLAGKVALVLGVGFMALSASVIWLFPRELASLFLDPSRPDNGPVLDLAVRFLAIAAIFQLADGAQVVGAAMLRGLQDTRVPMLFAAFGYWVIGLGGGALLAFPGGWQGVGVWTGLAGGLAAVAVLMLWRWSRRGRLGLISRPTG
jgi:MATE family multidrug resistance protein